jgi:phytanoyl-CoA hydroxylase
VRLEQSLRLAPHRQRISQQTIVNMLTNQQIWQYQEDGFLQGSRVFTDMEVDELHAELDRVIRDDGKAGIPQPSFISKGDFPVLRIVNIWQASEAFRKVVFSKRIAEEVAQLANANELRLWHDQILYKPAARGGVNFWHQDLPYWPSPPETTGNLRQNQMAKRILLAGIVTAWIALDDADVENGCMWMIPGSHRWGCRFDFLHSFRGRGFDSMPKDIEGRAIRLTPCPVEKGAVHFHHSLTWHGSGENLSSRPRRAVTVHYMTEGVRCVCEGSHPTDSFIPVDLGEKLEKERFPLVWAAAASRDVGHVQDFDA